MTSIQLEKPSLALTPSYLEFTSEMHSLGEKVWDGLLPQSSESHGDFVARLLKAETEAAAGLVTESTYWVTREKIVVGRIALRHYLNENLQEFGGHIGYEVRPSHRKQGIAREMLRQLLTLPKAQKIGKLLVTCSPDNIASNKTILANGGKLQKIEFVEKVSRATNYYWIEL